MGYMSRPRNSASRRHGRIAPLAKLPVFWALAGRKVLVAGGSDGAAWKAELLAACGAEVHVFAPIEEVDAAMAALIGTPGAAFVHHDCAWDEAYFRDFAMAVGDIETEAEAARFVAAAAQAGVPVNVIDKPAYCQFQFGSIVNRSPVVIGISTDGAAPILAQAIRRRVEAVLPVSLQDWAMLAARIRNRVNEALSPGGPRRQFWERFSDRALAGGADSEKPGMALVDNEIEQIRTACVPSLGSVAILATVSDDPDLLTLKAVRALQACDVIVHDERVAAGVLDLGRREAHRIACSDADPGSAARQVAAFAAAGRSVLRLTGSGATAARDYEQLRAIGVPPQWIASVDPEALAPPVVNPQRLWLAN
jgi:uroporphyrin-III C-methyltransferase/precorrin-2 dehydrogenase/sirohydrochlorin ferrochelatase